MSFFCEFFVDRGLPPGHLFETKSYKTNLSPFFIPDPHCPQTNLVIWTPAEVATPPVIVTPTAIHRPTTAGATPTADHHPHWASPSAASNRPPPTIHGAH